MDQQTVELMCLLQRGTYDAETWSRIEALLPEQRAHLVEAGKPAELADLADLLETWSAAASAPLAVAARLSAASIAEQELQQEERAIALYQQCLELDRTEFEAWHRLETLLSARGEHERLEQILFEQAEAMRARSDIDAGLTANAYQRLGQLRSEHGRIDGAIDAYEQALDLAPDNETLLEVADAYCARGHESDLRRASDLYAALGDVLAPAAATSMLERALDLTPDHDEALELLERLTPPEREAELLLPRWQAYIELSSNTAGVEARRAKLVPPDTDTATDTEIETDASAAPTDADLAGPTEAEPADDALAAQPSAGDDDEALDAPDEEAPDAFDHDASDGLAAEADAPVAVAPSAGAARDYNPKTLLGGFAIPPALAQAAADAKAGGRDYNPKTLLGIGLPSVGAAGDGAAAPGSAQADALRIPLFSGRAAERDAGGDPNAAGDWPQRLALSQTDAHVVGSGRTPLLASYGSGADSDARDDAEPGSPRLLQSSPPSYAFDEPSAAQPAERGGGLGRWALAVVLGISTGVAIAYAVRSSTTPAPREVAQAPAATQTMVMAATEAAQAAPAVPAPAPVPAPAVPAVAAEPPVAAPDAGEVKVAAQHLRVRGGLSAKEVAAALEVGLAEIESCYDSALARKATLRGTLKFSWSIDREGKASKLRRLGGTLKDATVERCSLDTIRDLQFPATKARATHVVAPLAFQTRTSS